MNALDASLLASGITLGLLGSAAILRLLGRHKEAWCLVWAAYGALGLSFLLLAVGTVQSHARPGAISSLATVSSA